jgi:3-oxoacyl-[acyl-carrier protein] reductase
MELGIAGKTALVTGAGRGLGAAICRSLASEGVRLIACSRTESDLNTLLGSVMNPNSHKSFATDLASPEGPKQLIQYVDGLGVDVDIVINNVGGTLGMDDPLLSPRDFWSVMHFNLGVAVELNAHFIPDMQKRGWGRICHVSSISALENQGPPAYCASKAALNAYLRSVGRFVSPDNVILTGIMPGAVMTEGGYWDKATKDRPEHVHKYLEERMAIKRFGRQEEISEAVAFLVSEHASFLVGTVILADGGQGRVFYPQGDQ